MLVIMHTALSRIVLVYCDLIGYFYLANCVVSGVVANDDNKRAQSNSNWLNHFGFTPLSYPRYVNAKKQNNS